MIGPVPEDILGGTMTKLGIIGAMQVEVETLVSQLKNKTVTQKAGSSFYEGTLEDLPVVIVQCGVGKVNAALCVQILCDCFAVTHIVNTGVAGSLCADLDIGDLVVSQDAMYHDFDCSVINENYSVGQVPGLDVLAFPANDALIGYAFAAAEAGNPGHTKIGRVASSDQFVCQKSLKEQIVRITGALCTEMEGAGIAQTAYRNKIPYVIIRAITDKADDTAEMDYPTFETIAAHRCAKVTTNLARQLYEAEDVN